MLELNQENFKKEVLESDKPVIVDFWAAWCGPCKMVAPTFEKVSGEFKNIKFAKLNVDEQTDLAQEYGVMSIPTFLVFKDGKEVERLVGVKSEQDFKEKLSNL